MTPRELAQQVLATRLAATVGQTVVCARGPVPVAVVAAWLLQDWRVEERITEEWTDADSTERVTERRLVLHGRGRP